MHQRKIILRDSSSLEKSYLQHSCNKSSVAILCKKFSQIASKQTNNPIKNCVKDASGTFLGERLQMGNKYENMFK